MLLLRGVFFCTDIGASSGDDDVDEEMEPSIVFLLSNNLQRSDPSSSWLFYLSTFMMIMLNKFCSNLHLASQ